VVVSFRCQPYYRRIAGRIPSLAGFHERTVFACSQAANKRKRALTASFEAHLSQEISSLVLRNWRQTVLSRRRHIKRIVSMTTGVVVLMFSLFGRPLHQLQHQIEAAGHSASADHAGFACDCGHHAPPERETPSDSPQHNSHDCGVCYVIGLAAVSSDFVIAAESRSALPDWICELNESAPRIAGVTICARGPPADCIQPSFV